MVRAFVVSGVLLLAAASCGDADPPADATTDPSTTTDPAGSESSTTGSDGQTSLAGSSSSTGIEPVCDAPVVCTDSGEFCLCALQELPPAPRYAFGDIDGDGADDLVMASTGEATWLSGAQPTAPPASLNGLEPDAALRLISGGPFGVGYVQGADADLTVGRVAAEGPQGTTHTVVGVPTNVHAGLGDFDGDGSTDLVWARETVGAGQVLSVFDEPVPSELPLELSDASPVSIALIEDLDRDGNSDAVLTVYSEHQIALFGDAMGLSATSSLELTAGYSGRDSFVRSDDPSRLLIANQCGDCPGAFASFRILEQVGPREFALAGNSSPVDDWQGNDVIAFEDAAGSVAVSLVTEAVLLPNGGNGRTFFGVSALTADSVADTGIAQDVSLSLVGSLDSGRGLLLVSRTAPEPALLVTTVVRASE